MKYSLVVFACAVLIVLSTSGYASRIELNATATSGGTSSSTTNLNLNNTDIGFTIDTGETGTIYWTNRTISNKATIQQVGMYIRHAAEGNKIDGNWVINILNESSGGSYCSLSTIAHSQNDKGDFWNTTSACSWTGSRIKQLRTDFASGDSPPGAAAYLYHIEIFVDYLDVPSWTANLDDETDPVTIEDNINYTATGTDPEGDNYRLTVCSTNAITDGYPGTCPGDTICTSAVTSSGSPTSCEYDTTGESAGDKTVYGFLCDAGLQKCSEATSATTTIQSAGAPPVFSDYRSNNASLVVSGKAYFNVTITGSNGTAVIEFDGVNYTASNTTATEFNATLDLVGSGDYSYYWGSWDGIAYYNYSNLQSYTVNESNLLVSYVSPTFSNGTTTTQQYLEYNTSIRDPSPKQITFNWNGTNYTFYNETTNLLLTFENLSALGEGSTTVADLSPAKYSGTIVGTGKVNSSGYYGGGYHGDGLTGSGIQFPNDLGVFANGHKFTFAAWFKPGNTTGIDDGVSMLMSRDINSGQAGIYYIGNTGKLELTRHNVAFIGRSDFSLPFGEWNHIVVTYNGSTGKFYLNGVFNSSGANVQSFTYSGELLIAQDKISRELNGSLDDVWLLNTTLNDTQIQQLYLTTLNKYSKDDWRLYINQTYNTTDLLGNGTYTAYTYVNSSDERNQTDYRVIEINTSYVAPAPAYPNITLYAPGADQTFPQASHNVTLNFTVASNISFDVRLYATNATNAENIRTHGLVGKYLGQSSGVNITYNMTSMPLTVENGLVVLLHLDNESFGGVTQNESTLYNYAGYVNSTMIVTNYSTGKMAWGAGMHGDNDEYIQVNFSNVQYTNLTFATWFYPKSFTSSADYIIGHSTASTPQNRIQLYTDDSSGILDLGLGGSHALRTGIRDLNTDEWYHFLLTMDSGTYNLYVNGELNATGTYSSFAAVAPSTDFGNNGLIGGSRVEEGNGIFDDIAIWNRSLSASEAWEVYRLRNDTYTWAVNVTDAEVGGEEMRNFTFGTIIVPNPLITLLNPQNITYARNTSIPLSYTATNAQACWYGLDGGENITLSGCTSTLINVSLGQHILRLYANNSDGVLNGTSNVTFVAAMPPFWTDEEVSPPSPQDFVEQQKYSFNITWTDYDGDLDTVVLTREGINYTPTLDEGHYNYTFTNLSALINQTYANFSVEGEINLTDHNDFSIGGTNFTVTMWIRPGESGATRFAMGKGVAGDYEWGVSHTGNSNQTTFTAYTAAGATANTISTGVNSTLQDEWSFVAFNYEEGVELSAFANYEYIDTDTSWGATASSGGDADLYIGTRVPGDSGERWNGSIDDVRIYSKKIYSAGIETIRNSIWRTDRVAVPFVNFHQYEAGYSGADTLYMNESAMRDYLSFLNNMSYVSVTDVDFINFSRGEKNYTVSNRPIVFMWDDGKDDLMDVAPLMAEYGYKGMAAIITDRVGDAGYVTWDNLITLVTVYNWSIASHTAAHCYAAYSSQANLNCSDEQTLTGNLSGSKQAIIDNVGVTPYTFVHPYNAWNATSMRYCAQYYTMCIGSPYQDGKATYNYIESNFTNGELVRTSVSVVDEYTLEKEWTYNFSYNLESLVGHWKLDENNGTDVYDSSGGGHTGSFVDTVTWETDGNIRPHEYYWWANDSRGYTNTTGTLYYLVNEVVVTGESTTVNASVAVGASGINDETGFSNRRGVQEFFNKIRTLRTQAVDKLIKQPLDLIADVIRKLLGIQGVDEDFSFFEAVGNLKGGNRGVKAVVSVVDSMGDNLLNLIRSNGLVVRVLDAVGRLVGNLRGAAEDANLLASLDVRKGVSRDTGDNLILKDAQGLRLSLIRSLSEDAGLSESALRRQFVWKNLIQLVVERADGSRGVVYNRISAVLSRILLSVDYATQQLYERGVSQVLSASNSVLRLFSGLRENYLPVNMIANLSRSLGAIRNSVQDIVVLSFLGVLKGLSLSVNDALALKADMQGIAGLDRDSSEMLGLLSASGRQTVLVRGMGEDFVVGAVGQRVAYLFIGVSEKFVIVFDVQRTVIEGVQFFYATVVELFGMNDAVLTANGFFRVLRENLLTFFGLDRILELGRGSALDFGVLEGTGRKGILTGDLFDILALKVAEDSSIQAVRGGSEAFLFSSSIDDLQWLERSLGDRVVLSAFGGRKAFLSVGLSDMFSIFTGAERFVISGVQSYSRSVFATLGLEEALDYSQELVRGIRLGILSFLGLDRFAELGRVSLLGVSLEEAVGRASDRTLGVSEGLVVGESPSVIVRAVRSFGDLLLALLGLDRQTDSARQIEQAILTQEAVGRLSESQKGVFQLATLRSTSISRLGVIRGASDSISFTSTLESMIWALRSPGDTIRMLFRLSIPSRQTLTVNVAQGFNLKETFSRAVSYWRGVFASLVAKLSCFFNGTHCDYVPGAATPTPTPSDSGGGGSRPSPTPIVEGQCSDWGPCTDGITKRECENGGEPWIEEEACIIVSEEGDKDTVRQTFIIKSTGNKHYAEYGRGEKSIWLSSKMILIYGLVLLLFATLIYFVITSGPKKKSAPIALTQTT